MGPTEQYREPLPRSEIGYAMAGLLVAIAVLGLLMSMAMPTWQTFVKREKEAELVFRGGQYARAISLYGQQFAGAFPPNVETLVRGRFLRKAYTDPMTPDGEFEIVTLGTLQNIPGLNPATEAGSDREPNRTPFSQAAQEQNEESGLILGVRSRSTEDSMMELNGLTNYADWIFTPTAAGLLGGHTEPQPMIVGGGGVGVGAIGQPVQPGDAGGFGPTRPGAGAFGGFGERTGAGGRATTGGPPDQRPGVGVPRSGGPGVGIGQPGSAGVGTGRPPD